MYHDFSEAISKLRNGEWKSGELGISKIGIKNMIAETDARQNGFKFCVLLFRLAKPAFVRYNENLHWKPVFIISV